MTLNIAQVSIETDGKTVWINNPTVCLGRFGRFGIDIHSDMEGQLNGKHCLDCLGSMNVTLEHWERFKAGMVYYHNIIVSDEYMPNWLRTQ